MKSEVYSKSVLASYATFKELYKSQNYSSPYQILAEFISYIITSKSLYSFTSTEIKSLLYEEFGFDLPIPVVCTALKNIKGLSRDDKSYIVDISGFNRKTDFRDYKIKSEEQSNTITSELVQYAKQKNINDDPKKLSQELIAFVMGEEGEQKYQQLISEFVIDHRSDVSVTETLSAVLEGGILYSGLAFNISEFGSIKKPLTLFLDTEIIFDIIGLNGELYKAIANDFINLVNTANRGRKMISLRYFSKVEDDINQFYYKAEQIVDGRGEINFNEAMKEIVKGCEDVSDISAKKVDLFRRLHTEYGIKKDEKLNYYTVADNQYNLEGIFLPDFPLSDEFNSEGFMFCSNINKLRKGVQETDYLLSQFLCITDTRRVREISNSLAEEFRNSVTGEKYCGYAVSLSYITNLLWYKMNRGFGSTEFPSNLDVVIKARVILSGYISQGISTTYKNIKTKCSSGELSKEQAAAYIVALKEKALLPEALDKDNIEDSLNFTEEYFARFSETLSQDRHLIKERDKTIAELSSNIKTLEERLLVANKQSNEKQEQIELLSLRLDAIEHQKEIESKQKKIKRAKRKLVWNIIWKIILIVVVLALIWFVCKWLKADFGTWLSVALGIVGCVSIGILVWKKDIKKYRDECDGVEP